MQEQVLKAVARLFAVDGSLWGKDRMHDGRGAHEQTISARLALHLSDVLREEHLLDGLFVDVEFSRNGRRLKEVSDWSLRPDVIVHDRTESPENNRVAIEVKPFWETDRGKHWQDVTRLRLMKKEPLHYASCFFVYLARGEQSGSEPMVWRVVAVDDVFKANEWACPFQLQDEELEDYGLKRVHLPTLDAVAAG